MCHSAEGPNTFQIFSNCFLKGSTEICLCLLVFCRRQNLQNEIAPRLHMNFCLLWQCGNARACGRCAFLLRHHHIYFTRNFIIFHVLRALPIGKSFSPPSKRRLLLLASTRMRNRKRFILSGQKAAGRQKLQLNCQKRLKDF